MCVTQRLGQRYDELYEIKLAFIHCMPLIHMEMCISDASHVVLSVCIGSSYAIIESTRMKHCFNWHVAHVHTSLAMSPPSVVFQIVASTIWWACHGTQNPYSKLSMI